MNIVLLPGLDGTGQLFDALLPYLSNQSVRIIPLPNSGDQSYEFLTAYVKHELPKDDFILVAESFSGPIGAMLSCTNIENLKGVIFVATFLSPPRKLLLNIFQFLPIKQLSKIPMASIILRYFMLGGNASKDSVKMFQQVVDSVPAAVLRRRMASIIAFSMKTENILIPTVYIRAESDKLVPSAKSKEFERHFENIAIMDVAGPHFILQANPNECAEIITSSLNLE